MLVENGILRHVYEETAHAGPRLGRHLFLDARSLAYTIERDVEAMAAPIKETERAPSVPVLNQGQLGSCTGHAGTYALSNLYRTHLGDVHLAGKALGPEEEIDEEFAQELYHEATVEDGYLGTWPPTDSGSSGLGVCRALHHAGLVTSYRWATSLRGFAQLLQSGPVMAGIPWFNSWFEPDAKGFIDHDPAWQHSGIAGGHEIMIEALESWNAEAPEYSVVRFCNSWGTGWGDSGTGRFRLSTYLAVKQQVDLKQLVLAG